MLTSMAYAVSEWGVAYDGKVDRLVDPGQHGFSNHKRLYPTADGWIYVECGTPASVAAFDTLAGTEHHVPREATCHGRDTSGLLSALAAAGVPAVRADGIAHGTFMLDDPHCRGRRIGRVLAGRPADLLTEHAGPATAFGAAPTPLAISPDNGDQTTAILRELGHDDGYVAKLRTSGSHGRSPTACRPDAGPRRPVSRRSARRR